MGIKRLLGVDGFRQDVVSRLQQVRLKSEELVTFGNGSRRDRGPGRLGKRRSIPVDGRWRECSSLDVSDLHLGRSITRVRALAENVDGVGEIVVGLALRSESKSPGRSGGLE